MDVQNAIAHRQSVRAFLDKPVEIETLHKILDIAKWAPSGVNHQPWQVAILGPNTRKQIGEAIISARESATPENPDYQYYPEIWEEPYKSRRKQCGQDLYGALKIEYGDKQRRKDQWYKNYHFFGAPAGLLFYIDAKLSTGSWMDVGGFLQNVMLSARGFGLETCAQAALAEYPDLVRNILGLPKTVSIVCGMSIGYADWNDPVNNYRTTREDLGVFVQSFD